MLNDMLLGQYVNGNSIIHHLWAGTKLIAVFALAIALVLLRWTPGYLICFAVLALTVWLARLPVGYLWRSSRFFIIILFIGMLPTLFFAEGDDPTRVVFGIWTVEGVR